ALSRRFLVLARCGSRSGLLLSRGGTGLRGAPPLRFRPVQLVSGLTLNPGTSEELSTAAPFNVYLQLTGMTLPWLPLAGKLTATKPYTWVMVKVLLSLEPEWLGSPAKV